MEPQAVLITRVTMIPLMILTARPYALWRDAIFRWSAPTVAYARAITDTDAFLSFQMPVYAATLALAGASPVEIVTAISAAIGSMLLLARPFGILLDAMRRWSGVTSA